MTHDEVFPSKYLKAADLKGRPTIVTIDRAPLENLKSLDGEEQQKVVLYFRGAQKSLPLNVTNFDAVCDATSVFDTEDWPGQRIELYPARTTMGGKTVDCIRIRPVSAPRSVAPPAPALAAQQQPADELSDDIPF
jgi:hypothetical protein